MKKYNSTLVICGLTTEVTLFMLAANTLKQDAAGIKNKHAYLYLPKTDRIDFSTKELSTAILLV